MNCGTLFRLEISLAAANCVRLRCTDHLNLTVEREKCKQHLPAASHRHRVVCFYYAFSCLSNVEEREPGQVIIPRGFLEFSESSAFLDPFFICKKGPQMMMMSLRVLPSGQSRHLNLFWTHLANSIIGQRNYSLREAR